MSTEAMVVDFEVFFTKHSTPMFLVAELSKEVLAWNESCQHLSGNHVVSNEKFGSYFPQLQSIDWEQDKDRLFYVDLPNGNSCTLSFNPKTVQFGGQRAYLFTVTDSFRTSKAERTLRDFYQAITESSIVSIADKSGTITYVNNNFVNISGYESEELIGQKHSIINSGHHPRQFWTDMWKTISAGKIWRAEVQNRAKDGRYYWVHTFIMPFLDNQGRVREYLSIRHDITQRKQQEEEIIQLNKSLSNFRLAIDTSSIVSRADKKGLIVYVNKKFEEISGYTSEELIGKNHNVVNSQHHPKVFWVNMWKTIASGKTWRAEVMNRAKDGSFYWVDTFVMPLVNEAGEVYEYLSIRNDISTRKAQEKMLEQNEEQLRLLVQRMNLAVNASGLGVWHLDLVNMTVQGNERTMEIYGIDKNLLPLDEFWDMIHPEDREEKKQTDLNQFGDAALEFYSEYRIIRPCDGEIRYLKSQGIFFRSPQGKIIAGISVVYDMTKDKEHEQSLLSSIVEKEMLIKEIHHRVKNNLQLISSMFFFKVMANGTAVIPLDFMNAMREKIKSVSLIHERLLQTEKLDSIDIKDYLEHLLNDIMVSHNSHNMELFMTMDIDHEFFTTDKATYLGQLVNELTLNAIKHAFVGRTKGNMSVALKKVEKKHVLTVTDDGVGLPASIDPMNSQSYGMQLIYVFIKQLKAELVITREGGTGFNVIF